MKLKLFLFLFFISVAIKGYPQSDQKNPFQPGLPQDDAGEEANGSVRENKEIVILPNTIEIEGVLWGSDTPLTIIDGEIYRKGDKLKNNQDISVFNIENNTVLLLYRGKIFIKRPARKRLEQRRR